MKKDALFLRGIQNHPALTPWASGQTPTAPPSGHGFAQCPCKQISPICRFQIRITVLLEWYPSLKIVMRFLMRYSISMKDEISARRLLEVFLKMEKRIWRRSFTHMKMSLFRNRLSNSHSCHSCQFAIFCQFIQIFNHFSQIFN